jgi:hypothetical protein
MNRLTSSLSSMTHTTGRIVPSVGVIFFTADSPWPLCGPLE